MSAQAKSCRRKTTKIKDEKDEEGKEPEKVEEKDLSFYIKDRVELMRQVFSIMRDRELLAMAPDCIRELGIGGIQEILLDEALGISSKRLHSILEGYPCPSDTESSDESANDLLETISLDSISSDDDILAQDPQSKRKHLKKKASKKIKDRQNNSISKKHKKLKALSKVINKEIPDEENPSGMTVLELLELQARARAIRAQLAAVEIKNTSNDEDDKNNQSQTTSDSDADEVVIKEEPPDIVEIHSSSDDGEHTKAVEKINSKSSNEVTDKNQSTAQVSTNQDPPRKIKLNRTNLLASITSSPACPQVPKSNSIERKEDDVLNDKSASSLITNDKESVKLSFKINASASSCSKTAVKNKTIDTNVKKIISDYSNQSSEDEIMLELSDSEKMDVLESLHSPEPVEERLKRPTINCMETKADDDSILTMEDDKLVDKNILSDEEFLVLTTDSPKTQDTDVNSVKKSKADAISDGECSNNSEELSATTEVISIVEEQDETVKMESKNENSTVDTDLSQSKDTEDSIFEISDDSDDGASSVLSKEPTREEIEELSRKIDCEINRDNFNIMEDVSINLKINDTVSEKKEDDVSWKSRWLESSKVKKVMATSNLCNALRKKNKELKNKLEKKTNEVAEGKIATPEPVQESFEGSVSHYQTLPASNKYTVPAKPPSNEESMKADAKQLMKMYKKLLKINNPEVKKHKKDKKKDKKEKRKKKVDKVKKCTQTVLNPNNTTDTVEKNKT